MPAMNGVPQRAASVDSVSLASAIVRPSQGAPRSISTDNWPMRVPPHQPPPVGHLAPPPASSGDTSQTMLRVKLGDFGTSCKIQQGKIVRHKVGTPAFMAPEMHLLPGRSPGYDHKVDVWAAGVVMV